MSATFFQQLPMSDAKKVYLEKKAAEKLNYTQVEIQSRIFESHSYSALDDDAQKTIFNYVRWMHNNPTSVRPAFQDLALLRKRLELTEAIQRYDERLNEINPASFRFMTDAEKTALAQELYFAFYIFSAQYHLDTTEKRDARRIERAEQIKRCARLLNDLRTTVANDPDGERKRCFDDSEKPVKYLGATIIAPVLIDIIEKMTANDTISAMDYVNGIRLYWVWARSFIDSVLGLFNVPDARQNLALPSPVTGYMSFVLYYARGAIRLGFLLKHTLVGPWMTDAESSLPTHERFQSQWQQRKFFILNDFIWATANMACYFWLIGDGLLGYWGNALTAILLIMDVTLNAWRFAEMEAHHHKTMSNYQRDIRALTAKIKQKEKKLAELRQQLAAASPEIRLKLEQQFTELDESLAVLQTQRKALVRTKKRLERTWEDQVMGLRYDLIYSIALLIAFCMLCGLFLPPSVLPAATMDMISLLGGALCFGFSVIYTSMSGSIEIHRSVQTKTQLQHDYKDHLERFITLMDSFELEKDDFMRNSIEHRLHQLYLVLEELKAQHPYQKKQIEAQRVQLIYSTCVNALVPALIFFSLMFLPLTASVSVLAVSFALVLFSGKLLQQLTPVKPTWDYDVQASFEGQPKPDAINDGCFYLHLQPRVYEIVNLTSIDPTYRVKHGKLHFGASGPHGVDVSLESNKVYFNLAKDPTKLKYSVITPQGEVVRSVISVAQLKRRGAELTQFTDKSCDDKALQPILLNIISLRGHIQMTQFACDVKSATGTLEHILLDDRDLGVYSAELRQHFKRKEALTQEHKKLVISLTKKLGYNFSLPIFDKKQFERFKLNARDEYKKILVSSHRKKGLFQKGSDAKPGVKSEPSRHSKKLS